MALIIQTQQKQHLKLLEAHPVKVLKNILYNFAAGKQTDKNHSEESADMNQAVIKLLIDAKRLKISERDFAVQLKNQTEFKDDSVELLWNFIDSETFLDDLITSNEYKFRDLEWRLESKVSSRYLHSLQPEPKVVLKIHLDNEKSLQHRLTLPEASDSSSKKELIIYLETDANSLVHIINQLELCLQSKKM